MNYKENVQRIIKEKNLSGVVVAKRLNVSASAFYRSLDNPTLQSMQRTARVLNVSVAELLQEKTRAAFLCPVCGAELDVTPIDK